MDGWMEDRKEGTRLRWNGIRLQLWSHFWMVRVMHAGALDGFRNYHVDIHTLKEEVIFIHRNPPTESRKNAVCIK